MLQVLGVCLLAVLFLGNAQIQITNLPFDQELHGVVSAGAWQFYSFATDSGESFTLHVIHASKYDLDLFVRKGNEVPSRQNFDYADTGFNPNITLVGKVESAPTHYVAGVYGFRGASVPFSILVKRSGGCPNDCSGRGTCGRNNKCYCNPGFGGDDCSSSVTVVTLGQNYGPYNLPKGQWQFFELELFSTQSLSIVVDKTSHTGDVDFYVRRAQLPTLFDYDYADLSRQATGHQSFSLNITNPLLGTWYIGAFSFESVTYQWRVTSSQSCPNMCSAHGNCIGISCSCAQDYYGTACEEMRYPLVFDHVYNGYVSANSWNYYTVTANSVNPVLINVIHPSDGSDCDVYVRPTYNPSLTDFTLRNVSLDPNITLTIPSPGSTPYKIGVYGYSSCRYTLKVTRTEGNTCDCGTHGRCVNGICICNTGWAGSKCEIGTQAAYSGVTYQGSVLPDKWQFYSFTTHATHQFVAVMKELQGTGDAWMYISMGSYPTLAHFNAADRNTRNDYHRISFRFQVLYNSTFYIGVYGNPNTLRPSIPFKITAYQVPF